MAWAIFAAGAAVAVVAGLCAFVIVLNELQQHVQRPYREAGRQAIVTAGFFLALGGVLAAVLPRLFSRTP